MTPRFTAHTLGHVDRFCWAGLFVNIL